MKGFVLVTELSEEASHLLHLPLEPNVWSEQLKNLQNFATTLHKLFIVLLVNLRQKLVNCFFYNTTLETKIVVFLQGRHISLKQLFINILRVL